jgi:hypothetical protein
MRADIEKTECIGASQSPPVVTVRTDPRDQGRMKRILFTAVILLLALAVLGPLLNRAGDLLHARALSMSSSSMSATIGPSTTPYGFKSLHGQEGFWRVGQDAQGVWWFVSPTGRTEFLNMVTTVQPFQRGRDGKGPDFVSKDWTGNANTQDTPQQLDHWATTTLQRVQSVGFKGLGAWCHPIFHNYDVPMTRDLNVWDWVDSGAKRLYSPDWSTEAEAAIKAQCQELRDNKNLIGYYTDNELDWGDDTSGPATYFDHLAPGDPNRDQVKSVIQSLWPTTKKFNQDWHTNLSDWKDLDTWDHLPKDVSPTAYSRLFSAWLSHLAGDYFRITTALVHQYDPNHLVMGVRFRGFAPEEVVRASAPYTDVVSLNYYVGDAKLDRDQFSMMYNVSHQPVVISEYSFHSLDGHSGDRDLVGFSAQVPDQRARADGYRLMTTRLSRVPYVVGADWFQWMDEPPSGRSSDGEDVNFGIVDIDDRTYPALAAAVGATTPLLNPLHQQSASDDDKDVWRDSYADKPMACVPYLTQPIIINGELSDWPANAKLQGMRIAQTVGLERQSLPNPNVYLGWTNDGLYMGLEVFDKDIEGAPATGWWWTKDNVEIWLSTHAIAADQTTYDVNCHQFFFVPNDQTAMDGAGGVVGQWHREGDALTDNLIPQPDVRQATRILPDRYVVEMFFPAKSLHGWDPKHQSSMAFNIHVKNYQHAIDYFWSAPKEVMTQLRPETWGVLKLAPSPLPRS